MTSQQDAEATIVEVAARAAYEAWMTSCGYADRAAWDKTTPSRKRSWRAVVSAAFDAAGFLPVPENPPARQLSSEQAAIIGAYTGVCCGPFSDIQGYAEKVLGRPIWTHEFADRALMDELKDAAREDFLSLCVAAGFVGERQP